MPSSSSGRTSWPADGVDDLRIVSNASTRGGTSPYSDYLSGTMTDMAESGGRRGRPYKGDRDQFISRPARAVGDEIRRRADAAGATYSDFISKILAEGLDMPEYAPAIPAQSDQGSLLSPQGGLHRQSA